MVSVGGVCGVCVGCVKCVCGGCVSRQISSLNRVGER